MHVLTLSSKIDDIHIRISGNIKRVTGDNLLWKMDPSDERAEINGRQGGRGREGPKKILSRLNMGNTS